MEEIERMNIKRRQWYVNRLSDQKDREKAEMDKSSGKYMGKGKLGKGGE